MWKRIKALKCFISNLKVEVNIFPFMSRLVFVLFPVMYVFDVIAVVFFISFEWCLIQMMLPGLPSEHESCVPTGGVAVSRFIYVCWLCHLVVTAFPFPCSLSELIQAPVWLIDSHEQSADVVNQNEYLATSIAHTHREPNTNGSTPKLPPMTGWAGWYTRPYLFKSTGARHLPEKVFPLLTPAALRGSHYYRLCWILG